MSYLHTRNLRFWRRARLHYSPITQEQLDMVFRYVHHSPEPVRADRVATPWLHFLRKKAKQP